MIKSKAQRPAAFTFIELTVTIAILMILASLLQPSLDKLIKRSYTLGCSQNQRELFLAFTHYLNDFDAYPNCISNIEGTNIGGLSWDDQLGLGYDGRNLKINRAERWVIPADEIGDVAKYQCPEAIIKRTPSLPMAIRTYAYNVNGYPNQNRKPRGLSNYWDKKARWSAKPFDVPQPSTTIILAEMPYGSMGNGGGAGINSRRQQNEWGLHIGLYNYLFADGHVGHLLRDESANFWDRKSD